MLNDLRLIKMNTKESKNLKRKRSEKFEFDPKQKKLSSSGKFCMIYDSVHQDSRRKKRTSSLQKTPNEMRPKN